MLQAAEVADDRLERLVSEIAAKGDFPAAARILQRLHDTVRRESCAVLDVARIILADPGLSSKVLRLVNSSYYRRREAVSTVTRAIILLGFESLRDLTAGLLVIDEISRTAGSREHIRDALGRSVLCGLVSRGLSQKLGYPHPEEAYLLGLFADWGGLCIAAYFPEALARARVVARERGIRLDAAIGEVLGVEPRNLAAGVLERWGFPPRYTDFFRRPAAGARAAPVDAASRLAVAVDLAAEYAAQAGRGRPEAAAALAQRYEEIFSRRPEEFGKVVEVAIEALREQAPLLRLPLLPGLAAEERGDVRRTDVAGAERCADSAMPGSAGGAVVKTASAADEHAALAILAEITRAILANDDINQTLSMVLEGIARTGRFDVAFLALLSAQRDRLLGRMGYGDGVREQLGRLSVPLSPGAGALAAAVLSREPQLAARGSSRLLAPPGMVPASLSVDSFVVHPLVVRGRAVGVLVAGRSAGSSVGPADLPLVELFCNQAALALDRVAS